MSCARRLPSCPYEFVAAVLVGGVEKLRGGEEYGVPLVENLDAALAYEPELVVDLSDEPVLPPQRRLELASRSLALGLRYLGPDFDFDPPRYEPFGLPSLAVIGTGKRIGKTALTGQLARVLSRDRELVVVAMGRGGPAEPELIEAAPTLDSLLELSRSGRHAASDHLETAALTGVRTIGCRRCGGGLAGQVASSNVAAGARLAEDLAPELVVFDGSGAAIPPVATDRRILVTSGAQDVRAGLNAYRVLVSDVVVAIGVDDEQVAAIRELKDVPVVRCELRLEPVEPIDGRVAVFAAGPATHRPPPGGRRRHLRKPCGSGQLAQRSRFRRCRDLRDRDQGSRNRRRRRGRPGARRPRRVRTERRRAASRRA